MVPAGPVFPRPRNETGGQAAVLGRLEVGGMCRHQHHFTGFQTEQTCGRLVRTRIGLIGFADIGTEHHIPRQPGVLRHIDQQSGVAVGQRPDNDVSLHGRDAVDTVRPRRQPAPRPGECLHLVAGQHVGGDAELLERCEEILFMQNIQRHEFATARKNLGHRWQVPATPFQRELSGVDAEMVVLREIAD